MFYLLCIRFRENVVLLCFFWFVTPKYLKKKLHGFAQFLSLPLISFFLSVEKKHFTQCFVILSSQRQKERDMVNCCTWRALQWFCIPMICGGINTKALFALKWFTDFKHQKTPQVRSCKPLAGVFFYAEVCRNRSYCTSCLVDMNLNKTFIYLFFKCICILN